MAARGPQIRRSWGLRLVSSLENVSCYSTKDQAWPCDPPITLGTCIPATHPGLLQAVHTWAGSGVLVPHPLLGRNQAGEEM